jgi:hypothetical protein
MFQHARTLRTRGQDNEASHKRPHIVRLHLYEMPRTGKSVHTESKLEVPRGWRKG